MSIKGLQRIGTSKSISARPAITIVFNGKQTDFLDIDLNTKTEAETKDLLTAEIKTDKIFVHKNTDGSWAIATSQEPNRWPEDPPLWGKIKPPWIK